ncbi:MAG: polysaccharide biosynthesis C-terminal domain-containing protein, partial [Kiritimatiellae bacterium]|nr:polysaccharide biosynthesis C-terminal domain-containing protein [Kiritimatiellia bacterium]
GLGFFGLQKTLVPWFQAQNDMKTPVRTTVATVVLNASLNILAVVLLPEEWRHVGLAFSTVVCAAVACVVLAACARRKNGSLGLAAVWRLALKQALAAAAMCVVLILVRPCIASLSVSSGAISRSATLLLLVISGVAVYLAVAFVLRAIPRLR